MNFMACKIHLHKAIKNIKKWPYMIVIFKYEGKCQKYVRSKNCW